VRLQAAPTKSRPKREVDPARRATIFRQRIGFNPGDELWVIWSSPGMLIVRKLSDIAADDELFRAEMGEFQQALQLAGYETREDIIKLVREVKAEQAEEWLAE
jgi:bifunctional DNA-binding transcriptional regulator/antitoxin component of YhaV-PrlF toxin-antitoxin module